MKRQHTNAFTLIELLTVIGIIVLLAAILMPTIGAAMRTARMAKVQSRLQNLASGCEHYKMDNGYYPGQAYSNQLTGSTPPGALTGSQMLGMCLIPPKNPSGTWNGVSSAGWGDASQRVGLYVNYKYSSDPLTADLFDPADSNSNAFVGTVSGMNRPCSVSDGFASKPTAILYYPSRAGAWGIGDKYKEGDNADYVLPSRDYMPSQPNNTSVEWRNMDPSGPPPNGDFYSYIRDYRLPSSTAHNDSGFLLMAANGKRFYACEDSPHNWSN